MILCSVIHDWRWDDSNHEESQERVLSVHLVIQMSVLSHVCPSINRWVRAHSHFFRHRGIKKLFTRKKKKKAQRKKGNGSCRKKKEKEKKKKKIQLENWNFSIPFFLFHSNWLIHERFQLRIMKDLGRRRNLDGRRTFFFFFSFSYSFSFFLPFEIIFNPSLRVKERKRMIQ